MRSGLTVEGAQPPEDQFQSLLYCIRTMYTVSEMEEAQLKLQGVVNFGMPFFDIIGSGSSP